MSMVDCFVWFLEALHILTARNPPGAKGPKYGRALDDGQDKSYNLFKPPISYSNTGGGRGDIVLQEGPPVVELEALDANEFDSRDYNYSRQVESHVAMERRLNQQAAVLPMHNHQLGGELLPFTGPTRQQPHLTVYARPDVGTSAFAAPTAIEQGASQNQLPQYYSAYAQRSLPFENGTASPSLPYSQGRPLPSTIPDILPSYHSFSGVLPHAYSEPKINMENTLVFRSIQFSPGGDYLAWCK